MTYVSNHNIAYLWLVTSVTKTGKNIDPIRLGLPYITRSREEIKTVSRLKARPTTEQSSIENRKRSEQQPEDAKSNAKRSRRKQGMKAGKYKCSSVRVDRGKPTGLTNIHVNQITILTAAIIRVVAQGRRITVVAAWHPLGHRRRRKDPSVADLLSQNNMSRITLAARATALEYGREERSLNIGSPTACAC
ncbi:hypothetical protein EAI_13068 [Harpegnathos saltator]|uniref:Uncharacterized protein n=1 Tax=Harpegnathos saltator TaxID=610380 RepID=E2C7B3_HARSA|nr:hypothetical protein EAI_13068 [Harpegnathos saltator]